MKTVKIGIIGAGTVGRGVLEILREQNDNLKARYDLNFEVVAVLDRSYQKKTELLQGIPASDDPAIVLENPEVDVVMELIGGQEPAFSYITTALKNGKSVITANKALLAARGQEIFELAQSQNRSIGFEAAVAGALPVIKTLRREFGMNKMESIYGILNGTCNFIITRMQQEKMDYGEALKLAQEKGFAEADPTFDVNGKDAAQKLVLIAGLAFDTLVQEDDIPTEGISEIRMVDMAIAEEMGWVIRLLAVARRQEDGSLLLRVHPAMIHKNHILASVEGEKNAVFYETSYSGPALIMGLGAGSHPTASAVISDLLALGKSDLENPEKWLVSTTPQKYTENHSYRYYLRFQTVDKPGVIADISRILADEEISIASVHQQEGAEPVNVVVITHTAQEKRLVRALESIDKLPFTLEPTVHLRIEEQI